MALIIGVIFDFKASIERSLEASDLEVVAMQTELITRNAIYVAVKVLLIFNVLILGIVYDHKRSSLKIAEMKTALDKSNIELKSILSSITAGVIRMQFDNRLSLVDLNESGYKLFGYTKEEFKEKFKNSALGVVYNEDREMTSKLIENLKVTGKLDSYQHRIVRRDGTIAMMAGTGTVVNGSDGQPIAVITFVDVSKQSEMAERLLYSEKRYQIAISNTNMTMFDYYTDKKRLVQPKIISERFNLDEVVENMPDGIINSGCIAPESIDQFRELYKKIDMGDNHASVVAHLIDKDGVDSYSEISLSNIFDGDKLTNMAIGIMKDITASKIQELDLIRKSERDLLTGLYNKSATQSRIEEIIMKSSPEDLHALFIIDIDNFKGINDNLGHVFGDAVLTEISTRLRNHFRSTDIVGRVGGDEYMTFLCNIKSETAVHEKAKEICKDLRKSYTTNNNTHSISASVGIAIYGRHGKTYGSLYYNADIALYTTKRGGKDGYSIFDGCTLDSLAEAIPREENRVAFDEQRPFSININSDIRSYIFEILYKAKDIQSSISLILELVGARFDVSRVYIFENTVDGLYTMNTYEWCNNGIEPEIQNLRKVKVSELGGFFSEYNSQGLFYCNDVRTLDHDLSNFLAVQGIKSVLHIAIEENGIIRGFVGFDDCDNYRMWSESEVGILSFVGKVIGTYILKKQVDDELIATNQNKKAILDNMDSFIYVINYDTYDLIYINKKTLELVESAKIGGKCYSTFWNERATPCEFCPLQGITSDGDRCTREIYNDTLDVWTMTTASKVNWTGLDNTVLLCCTDITKYKK